MTYRGRVEDGVVVLKDSPELQEGTEVEVTPVAGSPTWAEVFKDVIGKAEGLPSDSSRNHDHYLYGTVRK